MTAPDVLQYGARSLLGQRLKSLSLSPPPARRSKRRLSFSKEAVGKEGAETTYSCADLSSTVVAGYSGPVHDGGGLAVTFVGSSIGANEPERPATAGAPPSISNLVDLRSTRPKGKLRPVLQPPWNEEQNAEESCDKVRLAVESAAKDLIAPWEVGRNRAIRSFILNFLHERDGSIKRSIDLAKHAEETGNPIGDAAVQEVAKVQPLALALNLRGCTAVTDVGMWCVARHLPHLQRLNISGCTNITPVGLRSISLRCVDMTEFVADSCPQLDDKCLQVLAGGCRNLKHLSVANCTGISDLGIAVLARVCTGLISVNVSGCSRVGELGGPTFIALGRSCHSLQRLMAMGCTHVQDEGLTAIASGCHDLRELMLTGCTGLSGTALGTLAQGCPKLERLSLSGCDKLRDEDMQALADGCKHLKHLNISRCQGVGARGLRTLAAGLPQLTELDVSNCIRVNDEALAALELMNAWQLNISGCEAVTEAGVGSFARSCAALGSLNVSGCPHISRLFISRLCHSMRYSEPAVNYFGFQPKPNADVLKEQAKQEARTILACIRIQTCIRSRIARAHCASIRRALRQDRVIIHFQAIVRGFITRRWHAQWTESVRRERLVTSIQAAWWGHRARIHARMSASERLLEQRRKHLSTRVQRIWRGHRARCQVQSIRDSIAREEIRLAKERMEAIIAAICIQRIIRGALSRRAKHLLQKEQLNMEAQLKALDRSAQMICSFFLVARSRRRLNELRTEKVQQLLEWDMALRIQKAWRLSKAKTLRIVLQAIRMDKLRTAAAVTIQSFWRAVRGRHLMAIHRAMQSLRAKSHICALSIQRIWRGYRGRQRYEEIRAKLLREQLEQKSALVMQRVFRGHKGREAAEIHAALRALDNKIRPLQANQAELQVKSEVENKKLERLRSELGPLRERQKEIAEELVHAMNTQDRFTDSDKVNGVRQRFFTKFLQTRLVEMQAEGLKKIDSMDQSCLALEVSLRRTEKHLRQIHRELLPLKQGTVEQVKSRRTLRLRTLVRSREAAAVLIQKIFRGHRIRSAMASTVREYWIEQYDAATGDVYYWNTLSQVASWTQPLEMTLPAPSAFRRIGASPAAATAASAEY